MTTTIKKLESFVGSAKEIQNSTPFFQTYQGYDSKEKSDLGNMEKAILSYLDFIGYSYCQTSEVSYRNGIALNNSNLRSISFELQKIIGKNNSSTIATINTFLYGDKVKQFDIRENPKKILENLPCKSGMIDRLFDTITFVYSEDKERLRSVFKKFIVGSIATFFNTNESRNVNQLMPIFIGEKNIGKSYFVERLNYSTKYGRFLNSNVLSFSNFLKDEKEVQRSITTSFLTYFNEVQAKGFSNSNMESIKDFISNSECNYTLKFANQQSKFNRIGSLIAISNHKNLFGSAINENRKFFVIEMQSYDFESYNNLDKAEVFAEAYHLYKSGFNFNIDDKEVKALGLINERYKFEGSNNGFEENLILEKIKPTNEVPNKDNPNVVYMTASMILSMFEKEFKTTQKIAKILLEMRFKQVGKKITIDKKQYNNAWIVELVR